MTNPYTPGAGDREGGDGPSASLRGAARLRCIIAGCRHATQNQVFAAIATARLHEWGITEVVSGANKGWDSEARQHIGADYWGEVWAREKRIPVKQFIPRWLEHGKAAGPIRNGEMAANADALFAIWDGKSRGTRNMIEQARKRGLRVLVHLIPARSAPEASSPKGPLPATPEVTP